MALGRLRKTQMCEVTFWRLTSELQNMQCSYLPEKLSPKDEIYISDLKQEIMKRTDGLRILNNKAKEYIDKYSNKPPSERLPVSIPKSIGTYFDWGVSYVALGYIKTNQLHAEKIHNITKTTLASIEKTKPPFDVAKVILAALKDLDVCFSDLHAANIKEGSEVFDMLREVFMAYNFATTQDRLVKTAAPTMGH